MGGEGLGCWSRVFVSFSGTRFPSFLGEESGSFSYVERRVRFELVDYEGLEVGRKEGMNE